jgi:hypothetical protein
MDASGPDGILNSAVRGIADAFDCNLLIFGLGFLISLLDKSKTLEAFADMLALSITRGITPSFTTYDKSGFGMYQGRLRNVVGQLGIMAKPHASLSGWKHL